MNITISKLYNAFPEVYADVMNFKKILINALQCTINGLHHNCHQRAPREALARIARKDADIACWSSATMLMGHVFPDVPLISKETTVQVKYILTS